MNFIVVSHFEQKSYYYTTKLYLSYFYFIFFTKYISSYLLSLLSTFWPWESISHGPTSLKIVADVQCFLKVTSNVTVTSNVKVTFYVTVLFQVRKVPNSPKKTQKVLKSLKKSWKVSKSHIRRYNESHGQALETCFESRFYIKQEVISNSSYWKSQRSDR